MPAQGQKNRLHDHLQAELNIQPIKNRIAQIVIKKSLCSTSIVLPNVASGLRAPIFLQKATPWAMGVAYAFQAFTQGQSLPTHRPLRA
jgi:hypothetical protein